MQRPSIISGTIQSIETIAPHILSVTCTLTTPCLFVPGQYATVIIDEKTRRQYSFCSDSKQTNTVSFVIDTAPGGPGSQFFLKKRVGESLQLLAPLGTFTLHDSPRKKVLVATGTGIAPFKSMIVSHINQIPLTLYWGLRYETDRYWEREFSDLQRQRPTFTYSIVLSKPESTWKGLVGHVTEYVLKEEHLGDNDYYLCGNQHMIADVEQTLLAHAVSKEQIYTELF